jgi:hypothetical protein
MILNNMNRTILARGFGPRSDENTVYSKKLNKFFKTWKTYINFCVWKEVIPEPSDLVRNKQQYLEFVKWYYNNPDYQFMETK